MSTYVSVVISPATTTRPVVISVSQATRPFGSSARTASRTVSEIWSAILSGWPSVTDSDVNWKLRGAGMRRGYLLDPDERRQIRLALGARAPDHQRLQRPEVRVHLGGDRRARELDET